MRIDFRSATDQLGNHAATAAFRAGRGWIPQAAGNAPALNPDAWARRRGGPAAGGSGAVSRSVVIGEVLR
jgi:hypothetical protein